jgi:hypothetical protein
MNEYHVVKITMTTIAVLAVIAVAYSILQGLQGW